MDFLLFGEIVPIFKAPLWPYFLYNDYKERKIKEEIIRVNKSIYLFMEARRALYNRCPDDAQDKLILALKYAYETDTNTIRERYPELAEEIERDYIPALEKYIDVLSGIAEAENLSKADEKLIRFLNFYRNVITKDPL